MFGYMGKILRVDLTSGKIEEQALDEKMAQKYIGGSGLAARIIYDEVGPGVEPFSPDNSLVFAVGPYQGTGIPLSSRYEVATRSPLTGIWAEASSGGWVGPFLKRAGYDAIVIKGKAQKPVYLLVTDAGVEIKDASSLWGKDAYETEEKIRNELEDRDVRVACIGQGGENLVKFAGVMNDMGRTAGRSGVGAVMGSKNLKALAVKGKKTVSIADKGRLSKLIRGTAKLAKDGPVSVMYNKYGTAILLDIWESIGDVPFKYWARGDAKRGECARIAANIGGAKMQREILTKSYHCYGCPLGCGRLVKVTSPAKYAVEGHGAEYQSSAALGTLCMVDNMAAIAKANDMCNRYGIDTIETGSIIAFAMSCYEKGWIADSDTDGIDLEWGNADAVIAMVDKIGKREGLGDVLADGLIPAAQKIGHDSINIVMHSKGQAFPMHDPRAFPGLAIAYGTSERGACHMHGIGWAEPVGFGFTSFHIGGKGVKKYSLEGQPLNTKVSQDLADVSDSLVQCKFTVMAFITPKTQAAMLSAITGQEFDVEELLMAGERMFNLKRLFNCRFGMIRKDDIIPEMVPVPVTGNYVPKGEELEKAIDEYYELRGWTKDGIPTAAKIRELEIENVERPQ
ncbi:MAG TPA: aldehyde ferredoxin oxidoreductase family protein [Dehalococcoidia bacterium]|nr:aldehyde ferredoxin oxidoreductase family protein [Dehalococcoidia bacterium]